MSKIIICKECKMNKKHHAKGLCHACYQRIGKPLIICKDCQQEKSHLARGLCRACYLRQWRQENPEKSREYDLQYKARWPEKSKARFRKYNRVHREARLAWKRGYRIRKREEIKEYMKTYRRDKREQLRETERRWEKANPEKVLAKKHRRRAREAEVHNDLTAEQIMRIYTVGRCFYCFKPINLTLDHFVPITKGGGTTKANMVLACRKCNSSKHTKLPQEILAQLDFMGSINILE